MILKFLNDHKVFKLGIGTTLGYPRNDMVLRFQGHRLRQQQYSVCLNSMSTFSFTIVLGRLIKALQHTWAPMPMCTGQINLLQHFRAGTTTAEAIITETRPHLGGRRSAENSESFLCNTGATSCTLSLHTASVSSSTCLPTQLPAQIYCNHTITDTECICKAHIIIKTHGGIEMCIHVSDGQKLTKKLLTNSLIYLFQLDQ